MYKNNSFLYKNLQTQVPNLNEIERILCKKKIY